MAGMVSWIVCGALAGYIMSYLTSARDKGLVLLTLGVGVAGGVCGGFVAQVCGQGTSAIFSFYAVLFAIIGAAVSLLTYRRLTGV
jgi:uncharacterized membrane protein YeaQ/YmgE (transglycosylase-associated protein family)